MKKLVFAAVLLLGTTAELFGNGARFLIIVPDEFYEAVLPLAEWRTKTGLLTYVAKLSETGSSRTQIRSYIQNAYNIWNPRPEYVLIVGAPRIIPLGERYGVETDVYYADVQGSFYSDLAIGRLPVDDIDELRLIVHKILHYERWPHLDEDSLWVLKGVTGVAEDGDSDDTLYWNDARFAHEHWLQNGFVHIDSMSDFRGTSRSEFRNAMSEGRSVFMYRGQGVCHWHYPFNINPDELTNYYKFPVIISTTCRTISGGQDCADRDWLFAGDTIQPVGAVAFLGMTTVRVNAAIYRSKIARGFIKAVYANGERFGDAVESARRYLYEELHDMQDYYGTIAMGDPAMRIWTSHPNRIYVEYPPMVSIGPETLRIRVFIQDTKTPVENATVCIMSDDLEVYTYGQTDTAGTLWLTFNTTHPDTLSITVTGQNLIPFEGNIEVLPSGVYPYPLSLEAVEVIGNFDELLNPGETANLNLTVENLGNEAGANIVFAISSDDPFVEIVDSLDTLEILNAHQTVTLYNAFGVTISPDVHKSRQFDFELTIWDTSGNSWQYPLQLTVYTPTLEKLNLTIIDNGVGSNGDGKASPNESGEILFELVNASPTGLRSLTVSVESESTLMLVEPNVIVFDTLKPNDTLTNELSPVAFRISPRAIAGDTATFQIYLEGDGGSYTYNDTLEIRVPIGATTDPQFDRSYGYWAYDDTDLASGRAPSFDWFEIAPPGPGELISAITDEDADTVTLELPFEFKFYGLVYDSIGLCSNGFMELYHSTYRFGDNGPIPSTGGPMRLVAPFWDDLDPSLRGDIYGYYDAENHRVIIEFKGVAHYGRRNVRETFQVQFLDPQYYPTSTGDGQILFLYQSVADASNCTIGIEDHSQTRGIQYVFNSDYDIAAAPIQSNRAILFTTDPPIYWLTPSMSLLGYTVEDSIGGNGNGIIEPAETVRLWVEFQNIGGDVDSLWLTLRSEDVDVELIDTTTFVGDVQSGDIFDNHFDPFSFALVEQPSDTTIDLVLVMVGSNPSYSDSVELHLTNSIMPVVDESPSSGLKLSFGNFAPNPSRSTFVLKFQLPHDGEVEVEIYDVSGRLVSALSQELTAGNHVISWDGRDTDGRPLPAGVYYARISFCGKMIKPQKLVILR